MKELILTNYSSPFTDDMTTIRLLVITALGRSSPRLRVDEEAREIEFALKRAKYGRHFRIHWCHAARIADFREALLEHEPHIVHFSGHGDAKGIQVLDDIGFVELFSTDSLAALFELFSGTIECVVFNTCNSEAQAEAVNKHITYTIGTKRKLKDKAANEFSSGFYNALGAGKSIEEAFQIANIAVRTKYSQEELFEAPTLKKRIAGERKHLSLLESQREMLSVRLHVEHSGDVYQVNIPIDASTEVIKHRLFREIKGMELIKLVEGGIPEAYFLFSKTRNALLTDHKTLRANGIQNGEVLTFVLQYEKGENQ